MNAFSSAFLTEWKGTSEILAGGYMEQDHPILETDASTPHLPEDTLEPRIGESIIGVVPTNPCSHSRAIDDVLTKTKKRTGKVLCLECGTVIDDPYNKHTAS